MKNLSILTRGLTALIAVGFITCMSGEVKADKADLNCKNVCRRSYSAAMHACLNAKTRIGVVTANPDCFAVVIDHHNTCGCPLTPPPLCQDICSRSYHDGMQVCTNGATDTKTVSKCSKMVLANHKRCSCPVKKTG